MEQKHQEPGELGLTRKIIIKSLLVLVLYGGIIITVCHNEFKEPSIIENESVIPDWDRSKIPFYYDYYKEEWVYKKESPRANGYKGKRSDREIENLIEEKLIEGVDGYLEETYWGENYDLNDIED